MTGPHPVTRSSRVASIAAAILAIGGATNSFAATEPVVPGGAWKEISNPRVQLLFNGSERSARQLFSELEQLRAAVVRMMPHVRTQAISPLQIFLFAHDRDFVPFKPLRPDGRPLVSAAAVFARWRTGDFILLSNESGEQATRIVYHEYFHYLVANTLGNVPLWLNEGLAEFFSTFKYVEREHRVEIGHAIAPHMTWLASSIFLPTRKLLAVRRDSPDYNEEVRVGTFYAESWLVVHYLQIGSPERAGALTEFLKGRSAGLDDVAAFEKAVGTSVEKFDDEMSAYQRRRLMKYNSFQVDPLPKSEVGAVQDVSPEDVRVRLKAFLDGRPTSPH